MWRKAGKAQLGCTCKEVRSGPKAAGIGFAQRADLQETGDAAATGGVGLENIHGACLEHASEIEEVVAILTGGDIHAGRGAVSESLRPARSSDETGSSNQQTLNSANASALARACLRL